MFRLESVFVLVIGLAAILNGQSVQGPPHDKVVVCYVAAWAVYRKGDGFFPLDRLDPALCTHLVYSFAGLDAEKKAIKSLDPWQDLTDDGGKGGYNRMVSFKSRYPHLKVTLAIGGWNEGSIKYSQMAADPQARAQFVQSSVSFLKQFGFDGLDLDWEYPAKRGGKPEDRANYVSLVKELKKAFKPHGMILTAALGVGKDTMDAAYDLPELSQHLDLLHLMCYDYHGTWDGVVGANAPLNGLHDKDVLSVEYSIKYMLSHGVPPRKMVLGLPFYGRTFILTEPAVKEVHFGNTTAQSKGFPGRLTNEAGFMGYNEICLELSNSSSNWQRLWHDASGTPYLRKADRVISYDDPRSIAMKVKMAVDYGLGGLMVWSIDTDDFLGACASDADPFVDFRSRLDALRRSPVVDVIVQSLNLPDGSQEILSDRSAYVVDNGALALRVPARRFNNYPLMRTISEAAALATQEREINARVEAKMRENEVADEGRAAVKGKGGDVRAALWVLCAGLALLAV